MRRVAFLAVMALLGVSLLAQPAPQAAGQPPAAADLTGKVLLVNYRMSSGPRHTVLQNAAIRRLGSREFLTGDLVLPDGAGAAADWQGAIHWVPLDAVESVVVFADKDKALRIAGAAGVLPMSGGPKDKQ